MNRSREASFTRPDDTNVYTSGDVINNSVSAGTAWTLPRVLAFKGNSGTLVSAVLIDSANQPTKLSSELWVFSAAVAADNDNAPFTPTDLELQSLLGIIPFTTAFVGDATAGAGGNVVFQATDMAKVFTSGITSQDLHGVLVARNAYTPVSGETFTVRLGLQE